MREVIFNKSLDKTMLRIERKRTEVPQFPALKSKSKASIFRAQDPEKDPLMNRTPVLENELLFTPELVDNIQTVHFLYTLYM